MKVSFLTASDSDVLQRPIDFPVLVNGENLVATITALTDNELPDEFHISFSDGYSDRFVMTESGYAKGRQKISSKRYAAAIRGDLQMLRFLTKDEHTWNFRHASNGNESNAWIRLGNNNGGISYDVYYDGDYRFHFSRSSSSWRICDNRVKPRNLDQHLVKRAIAVIELNCPDA